MNLRVLIPSFFLLLLLTVLIFELLNHSSKLHHINRSLCDLGWYHIVLFTFSDEIILDNTQELTHIWVISYHVFKSLHLIHFEHLLFEQRELLYLLFSNLILFLGQFQIVFGLTLFTFFFLHTWHGSLSLLLHFILSLLILVELCR